LPCLAKDAIELLLQILGAIVGGHSD
jgi:hypothetical protein